MQKTPLLWFKMVLNWKAVHTTTSSILYPWAITVFVFFLPETTRTVHPSGSSEADTSSIRSRCIPRINHRTSVRNGWAEKSLRTHAENDWSCECICVCELFVLLRKREKKKPATRRKMEGSKRREKWQLIGVWVSRGESSVIRFCWLLNCSEI